MTASKSVLISGAGVAGTTLAYWLTRLGMRPTLVEQAPAFRSGGHAIDVRGAALRVLERMNLRERVEAASTRMRGMSVVDAEGRELMRTEEGTLTGGPKGTGVELFRDALCELLAAETASTPCRFQESITALRDGDDGIEVTFASGAQETFDLVVGADGLHSALRGMVFGPESDYVHPLGQVLAVFPMQNFLGLDRWQTFFHGEREMVGVYSATDPGEVRVMLGAESPPLAISHPDIEGQKAWIAQRFANVGWVTPQLLEAMMTARSFYFDAMSQVRMSAYSKGRVVLVGDAAYSPSPLSGQGTSVAIVAAYVLAHALAVHPDHRTAFAIYEAQIRPFAEKNQQLALDGLERRAPPDAAQLGAAIDAIDLPMHGVGSA